MPEFSPVEEILKEDVQNLTYEKAFSQLEAVVAALESGDLPLEQSLALFERGQLLARYCQEQLDQAELKIQQITGGELVDYSGEA